MKLKARTQDLKDLCSDFKVNVSCVPSFLESHNHGFYESCEMICKLVFKGVVPAAGLEPARP